MHNFWSNKQPDPGSDEYKDVSRPRSGRKAVKNGQKSMFFRLKKAILTVAKKAGNGYNINF
jgi:hypothetical protein